MACFTALPVARNASRLRAGLDDQSRRQVGDAAPAVYFGQVTHAYELYAVLWREQDVHTIRPPIIPLESIHLDQIIGSEDHRLEVGGFCNGL